MAVLVQRPATPLALAPPHCSAALSQAGSAIARSHLHLASAAQCAQSPPPGAVAAAALASAAPTGAPAEAAALLAGLLAPGRPGPPAAGRHAAEGEEEEQPRRFHFFLGGDGPGEIFLREGRPCLENTGWRLWRGSYTMARYLERCRPRAADWEGLSVLDLSCGVGLCGLALCRVCADVTLTELPENLEVVRRNVAENCAAGGSWRCKAPTVVPHAWGAALPPELQRGFDLIVCNDLLYEVFHRKLHGEFHATLRDLVARQRQAAGPQVLICFQVRATPQERRILRDTSVRLNLQAEEVEVGELPDGLEGPDGRGPAQRPKLRLVSLKA